MLAGIGQLLVRADLMFMSEHPLQRQPPLRAGSHYWRDRQQATLKEKQSITRARFEGSPAHLVKYVPCSAKNLSVS